MRSTKKTIQLYNNSILTSILNIHVCIFFSTKRWSYVEISCKNYFLIDMTEYFIPLYPLSIHIKKCQVSWKTINKSNVAGIDTPFRRSQRGVDLNPVTLKCLYIFKNIKLKRSIKDKRDL